jgi:hypothetical protein
MSATHNRSGSLAVKFLSTMSGAACWREMRWVVLILLPRRQPLSFARRMSLATRFLAQRMPMALSSACTLGAP